MHLHSEKTNNLWNITGLRETWCHEVSHAVQLTCFCGVCISLRSASCDYNVHVAVMSLPCTASPKIKVLLAKGPYLASAEHAFFFSDLFLSFSERKWEVKQEPFSEAHHYKFSLEFSSCLGSGLEWSECHGKFIHSFCFALALKPATGTWGGNTRWSRSQSVTGYHAHTHSHIPSHLGAIQSSQYTYWYVFGRSEETREPIRNPHGHWENTWNATQAGREFRVEFYW